MFRTTCRVNAFPAAGFDRGETIESFKSSDSWGSGEAVDWRCGDPSLVRYPGGWSSLSTLNSDMASLPSTSFSEPFESAHGQNFLISHFPASRPGSRRCFFSTCVSSRNRNPTTTPHDTMNVMTRFGRRYGNRSQIEPSWNRPCNRLLCIGLPASTGFANADPRIGPRIDLANGQ